MEIIPPPRITRRIVLQQTQGKHKGLWWIMGTDDELLDPEGTVTLPDFVEHVDVGDHEASCSLISAKPRYVLYREVMPPAGKTAEFHPDQM